MKNRDYKIFRENNYYHVYNRGNNKQDIFFEPNDYKLFLSRLDENLFGLEHVAKKGEYKRKILPAGAFTLIAYCLMPNHFHLIIRQNSTIPVNKFMSKVLTSYSKNINKKYERVGNLFQDQFKSIHIPTDEYILWLSAYIHNNPFSAGIVQSLADYQWSSYLDYMSMRRGHLCDKEFILGFFHSDTKRFENFVIQANEKIKQRKDIQLMLLE